VASNPERSTAVLTMQKRTVDSGIVVLEISGTLTLGRDCQQVEWQLEDLLREKETKVVLDVAGLNQIDSTGVGIVVMCSGKLKKAGGELRLAGASGMVEKVLKMTSIDQIIHFYPTAAAATENFAGPGPA
jgi:anti-sigma B factor antagonist